MKLLNPLAVVAAGLLLTACDNQLPYAADADGNGHTAPTAATVAANSAVLEALDFSKQKILKNLIYV